MSLRHDFFSSDPLQKVHIYAKNRTFLTTIVFAICICCLGSTQPEYTIVSVCSWLAKQQSVFLTVFSLYSQDVSPEIQPPEGTLVLEAVTYIGIIISIFCLLITIISYLSSKSVQHS